MAVVLHEGVGGLHPRSQVPAVDAGLGRNDVEAHIREAGPGGLDEELEVVQDALGSLSRARVIVAFVDQDCPRFIFQDQFIEVVNDIRELASAEPARDNCQSRQVFSDARVPHPHGTAADADDGPLGG